MKRWLTKSLLLGLFLAVWPIAADAASASPGLKLVSFNLYNRPWHRQARLERAQALLRRLDADIVALQEVAQYFWEEHEATHGWDKGLERQRVFAFTEDRWIWDSGLALLSRYPILARGTVIFETNRMFNTKGFLWAVVETPWGQLGVINAHLAATEGGPIKEAQFERLYRFVAQMRQEMPVVVLGDFNEEPLTPLRRRFRNLLQAESLHGVFPPGHVRRTWSGGYGHSCDHLQAKLLDDMELVPRRIRLDPPVALPSITHWRFATGGIVATRPPYPSDHCPIVATVVPEGAHRR